MNGGAERWSDFGPESLVPNNAVERYCFRQSFDSQLGLYEVMEERSSLLPLSTFLVLGLISK